MPATAEGTVIRTDAKVVHVDVNGEVRTFAPRGRLFDTLDEEVKNPIAVGDRVTVSLEGDPPGVEAVLPRRNYLPRVASSHDPRAQILFANVDQLIVVGSIGQPGFSSNRTDRILAACAYHEIPATVLLNKADLDRGGEIETIQATYIAAGIPVLETAATEGRGLDAFRFLLSGKITVLYGASGAGKSTLINAIEPGLDIKVGRISRYWSAGKHTTSFSQMHRLPTLDGWVVDTPGIRRFRLAGINKAELRDLFGEFAPFALKCQFGGACTHDHEPGCAVFDAVEAGHIAPTRYQSYVEILDELEPPPEEIPDVEPEGEPG
ncbi:MAG: ribosome small subunit-dependent GTPase A [Planctomycetota bacterium]